MQIFRKISFQFQFFDTIGLTNLSNLWSDIVPCVFAIIQGTFYRLNRCQNIHLVPKSFELYKVSCISGGALLSHRGVDSFLNPGRRGAGIEVSPS